MPIPIPNLTLGGAGPSAGHNSGGNTNVAIGAAGALPAGFWGTPNQNGGTSTLGPLGGSFSLAGIAVTVGVVLLALYLGKRYKIT